MVHGQPDYGMYSIASTIYKLADMGELAARLGSIVTHDRRGDVIWLDNFESNINKWLQTTVGVGASIALSAEAARNGGLSAKLITGNAINNYAQIAKAVPYPVLSNMGFEISFVVHDDMSLYRMWQRIYTGVLALTGSIQYSHALKTLYYLDSGNVYQVIAVGIDLEDDIHLFHTMKLVVDYVNGKYKRLILNEHTYDLSAYDIYSVASGFNRYMLIWFEGLTAVAANTPFYVDDAIITQNEP